MGNQLNPYVVRPTVFRSGERFPILRSRTTGLPLFQPTLYAATVLRAKNRAAATIEQALRAVMVLQLALDRMGVDLDERLRDGTLLHLQEIDKVARYCNSCVDALMPGGGEDGQGRSRARVVTLESVRMRPSRGGQAAQVDSGSAAIRLLYIREYLNWRATARLLQVGPKHSIYHGLKSQSNLLYRALSERIPPSSGGENNGIREGLSKEEQARLLQVIEPSSPDNPWKNEHAKERNALMVKLFLSLGVRRGELLGVRTSDFNFQNNEVRITRHADDPDDPRKDQPNTKTRDRLLPLDDNLVTLTRRYIMEFRRKFKGARKHEFLFVANGSGAPMSLDAVNKAFNEIERACPDIAKKLFPHLLRYTCNDRFTELMDERRIPEDREKKMRSRLMGWSETSNSAAIYTRRHVQRKAREAAIQMQQALKKAMS